MKIGGIISYPRIILGGFLALTVLAMMNSSYSYLLDAIKSDLSLNYTQSGALMSAYFIGYTLGQIPWGVLADRYGSRRIISISILGVSVFTGLFGYSTNFFVAFATRFLSGLLGAGVFVPVVRLISGWYNSNERGTALGIMNIGGSVGLILVTWMSPLLAAAFNWRISIGIQCIFGVTLSTLIWLSIRDGNISKNNSRSKIVLAFRQRSFWILALAQFIRLGSYYTFLAWLPLMLKEDYSLGVVAVGGAMSLFNMAGMVSNPVGGILADKIGEKPVILFSFLLLSLSVSAYIFIPNSGLLFLETFLLGWFINFVRSPSFTIIPRLFGPETAGSLSGFHNTFASFGALVLPLVLGVVKDSTASYSIGWIILIILLLISAILLATVRTSVKSDSLLSSG